MRKALWIVLVMAAWCGVAAGQTYFNLDDSGLGTPGWQAACVGPPCAGGVTAPTFWNQTFVNSTPSLDGNSMMMTETGTNYANVMFHYAFGANNSATTFTGDYQAYILSTTPYQVFGMDMYQYIPGVRLMFGSQCALAGSTAGFWSFFDQGDNPPNGTWKVSTVPCPLTSATWYHITMTVHRVPGDTSCAGGVPAEHYDSITQNGTTYPLNLSYCSETTAFANDTGMQFDVSSNSTGGTLTAFVDEQNYEASTGGTLSAPTCVPGSGTYSGTQTVSCTLPGLSTGCYTTNGVAPTAPTAGTCGAGSTTYSGAISVSASETLEILATQSGFSNSSATAYTYTITSSFTLTVTVSGSGTVTSSPAGISCPSTCSASFTSGTVVTLSEAPNSGSYFSAWTGACTFAPCSVTMSAAESVTATFVAPTGNSLGACTSTLVIPPPTAAPFSGLLGAGTVVMDPEPIAGGNLSGCFHVPLVRLTDANTGPTACAAQGGTCPANLGAVVNNADGQDNQWSMDETQFSWLDSGDRYFIEDFNPGTGLAIGVRYTNNGHSLLMWTLPTASHVTSKLFYSYANTAGSNNGPVLSSYDTSQHYPTLPTRTPVFDFSSSVNCVPSSYIYETDASSQDVTDTIFTDGFSTSSTQNTARYAAQYTKGLGCVAWNTATGQITGDWGTTGPAVCVNCAGGPITPGTFTIHNVKATPDGKYVLVGAEVCDIGSSCPHAASPYVWQVGTTNVYACNNGTGDMCSGHWIAGYTGFVTQYSIPYFVLKPWTTQTGTSFPTAPSCFAGVSSDNHSSWWNDLPGDQQPFFLTTSFGNTPSYTSCNVDELDAIFPPTNAALSGTTLRFAHLYGGNVGSTLASQYQIITVSPTGRFALATSPMVNTATGLGQLGDQNGNAICTSAPICRSDIFAVWLSPFSIGRPRQLNAVQPPQPTGTNNAHYLNVLLENNVRLTGQTVIWGGGNSATSPGYFDTETGTGACAATLSFAPFDAVVADYTLTHLLVAPQTEGNTNEYTPACVYSQAQADASYLPWTPSTAYLGSDYIFQNGHYWQSQTTCGNSTYDATCVSGSTLPTCFASLTSPCLDNQISPGWVNVGTHAPPQDAYCGPSFTGGTGGTSCYANNGSHNILININNYGTACSPGPCTLTNLYQAEAITSELPFRNWYIGQAIPGVIVHYNYLPNFGYIRFGCTAGGECDPLGVGSGLYPFYGSTAAQQRATYLSYMKILDTAIMAAKPVMPVLHDLNCSASDDCEYADQAAYLAWSLNFKGISTNALDVNDIENLLGNGPNNCAFPLVAASGCTTGDWAYLFSTYITNQQGGLMWDGLQTATASEPFYCVQGFTGPLFPPIGISGCSGYPGALPFLVRMRLFGVGSPNVKIDVNNLELYTNPANQACTLPNCQAGDILLGMDPSYSSSALVQSAFVPYQTTQAQAFYNWLFPFASPTTLTFVARGGAVPAWWNKLEFAGER